MRQISYKDMVPDTLYYIQRAKLYGNGKQKGIFVKQNEDNNYLVFKYITNVAGKSGYEPSYKDCIYCINACNSTFYVPEKEEIYQKVITNILRKIIGDEYFIY